MTSHNATPATPTPTHTPAPTASAASPAIGPMDILLLQMEAMAVDPAELAAYATAQVPGGVTTADFLTERVLPALTKGTREAWRSYLPVITEGLSGLCSCHCPACLAAFSGNGAWAPCPCVTDGRCGCATKDLGRGAVATGSCLEGAPVLGSRPLASLALADWEALARWTQLRAQKRIAVRNAKRATQGRATHLHDGRSAVEHLRNLVSACYKLALADRVPGVRENLGTQMTLKPRPAVVARGYTEAQLAELWQAIFYSGDDPELDMLLVWFCLETGSRRGGPLGLQIGHLLFGASKVRLAEKNGKVDDQPVSARLLRLLLTHALRRGDVIVTKPAGLDVADIKPADVLARRVVLRTDAPVFYYHRPRKVVAADGSVAWVPHPITRRRFETLWSRLKRELPWLDELHGRPHDLRKTMGTFVERAFGHAVAKGWLRHTVPDVTGGYTMAAADEIAEVAKWLEGAHPGMAPGAVGSA